MTEYFQAYSKPMVKATSSIYDPNLIQSSSVLLTLYLYLQKIITSLRDILETLNDPVRFKSVKYLFSDNLCAVHL
ncbi:unnamed protein product, partial [Rotaria sp. Silwood1]